MRIPFINKLKNKTKGPVKTENYSSFPKNNTSDRIDINLWGLNLSVNRDTTLDIPSELSVIIPRVELRKKYTSSPTPSYETEIIMSSITVVLAPRHRPENGESPSEKSELSRHRKK